MQNHDSNRAVAPKCCPIRKFYYLFIVRHGIRHAPCVVFCESNWRVVHYHQKISSHSYIRLKTPFGNLTSALFILGGIRFERIVISEKPRFVLHHSFTWLAKPFGILRNSYPRFFWHLTACPRNGLGTVNFYHDLLRRAHIISVLVDSIKMEAVKQFNQEVRF